MITFEAKALKETKPHEYALRFAFGGLACVVAGLVAKWFGPAVGGLFLAFPAIFPASATLIESHAERREKAKGKDGTGLGRTEAATDAAGSAVGCVGLAAFALVVSHLLPGHDPVPVIALAVACWAICAGGLWFVLRKRIA